MADQSRMSKSASIENATRNRISVNQSIMIWLGMTSAQQLGLSESFSIETESLSSSMEINLTNWSSSERVRRHVTSTFQSIMNQSSKKGAKSEVYGNIISAQQLGLSQSVSIENATRNRISANQSIMIWLGMTSAQQLGLSESFSIETESLSSSMEINLTNWSSRERVRRHMTSNYQSIMNQSLIKEETSEVYGSIISAQQLGLSQSVSIEKAILISVNLNLMLPDYSSPFMVNFYGRKLRYSITTKQGYVSTSIKRNWAKNIEILYSFNECISATHGMIVYLSNKNTMEQTSTVAVLGSSSGKIKVNIEPDGSYTVHIVYLHINALHSGTEYQVSIQHVYKQEVTCTHIRAHVQIFTVSELRQLEKKCRTFTPNQFLSPVMKHIKNFYRNKPTAYFSEIKQNGGEMVPYIKDMSGDKCCPINGRIDGLFFMTNLDRNSSNPERLPPCSPFGSRRLIVPTQKLFSFTNKLYFSDFFCMKDHYVSLVITKPGSQADLYCQSHLLPLDVYDNPYLRLDVSGNAFALHMPGLWVEVMYTETVNVNMPGARWETVRTLGRGESTPGGIPKKTYCPHCNL